MRKSGLKIRPISEKAGKHKQKIMYLMVGAWNTAFGFASFIFLYYALQSLLHYSLILIVSYFISITNAYVGYKIFVFKTKGNYLREYLRFYIVYGSVFLLNMALLVFAVELLKVDPLYSQAVILVVTVIISYLGHKYFTFDRVS